MGSFTVEQADKVGGQGGGGFFSLKNDKDVARVRFLFNGIEDVQAHTVHEVMVDGKKRWVDCLREYGDPVDTCPFCKAGRFINVRYFLPLYNMETEQIQIWERGKKFGSKLSSMCSRYSNPSIVSHIFEIERNGKPGDQTTTYEVYECGQTDGVTLEDFDFADPNKVILKKSAEEMQEYLSRGSFPNGGGSQSGGSEEAAPVYQRRTPAGGSGRREAF